VRRVYFTDRDLGKQFPRILADAGIAVERHGDLFQPDGSDEQWLERFVRTLPRIEMMLDGRVPPFIAKVYRATPTELAKVPAASGRVEVWYPKP
jgi:hypothetical protein